MLRCYLTSIDEEYNVFAGLDMMMKDDDDDDDVENVVGYVTCDMSH